MSKALRTVSKIAGVLSIVLIPVNPALASAMAVVSSVAAVGAQVTAKKPPAKGSINGVTIATDAPAPYLIGRTFYGGILRHDAGYGPTLKKVKNPYRGMVIEYSVAGPLEELEGLYLDFQPISFTGAAATGYYANYLYRDFRLGLASETALAPFWTGMPNWTTAHKLSGKAAVLWNLKFDKNGKRFASGVPVQGAVWKGVKCYDPRLDDTYPGGEGGHRMDDPATWEWSECPGLHALKYALGSYQNGIKVFGVGLPVAGIMVEHFIALANVCDANGWKVGGVIFEPGDRWANLKDILQAGGAEPLFIGGKLGLKINAPRVSLDTVTPADLADDDAEITAMQSWRDRRNGIIPKYRSEANKWDYVQSDMVQVADYVTEDGEEKNEERQYNLVQDKDHAAQLAGYELVNGRERFPLVLPCKPRLRKYGPGDMLTLELPDHDLDGVDAVIVDRSMDPATMVVTLTFMEETPGKHATVLALTGTAPPPPDLVDPADRDDISDAILDGVVSAPATGLSVIDQSGSALVKWRNPTNSTFSHVNIFRGTTTVFEDATQIAGPIIGGLGELQEFSDPAPAGYYYWWVQAVDNESDAADPTGPVGSDVGVFYLTNSLPTGATLTRASAGYYRDASGVWTSAATDVARFDHRWNGSAWVASGLLVEAAATNLALQSRDMSNASWVKSNLTATATRLNETAVSSDHRIDQIGSYVNGQSYCFSVEASEVSGSPKRYLTLRLASAIFGGSNRYAKFDLSSGTVTYFASGVVAGIEAAGAGKWLCWITATATVTTSAGAQMRLDNASGSSLANYTGDIAAALDISEIQVEIGTRPTSRIPTTTATVARAADIVTLDWAGRNVADGSINVLYTFGNGATQAGTMTVASGVANIPTPLNRSAVARIDRT